MRVPADPAGDDGSGARRARQRCWSAAALIDEGDDRIPVVEDLAREGTHLVRDLVLNALTVPLQTGDQPLDGCVAIAGSDLLDEAAQITREIAAEGGAGMVVALGERHRLADEVCEAALSTRMVAVGDITIAYEPPQEGFADQCGQLFPGATADAEHHHRGGGDPQPQQRAALGTSWRLVEVHHFGTDLLNQVLDHRLAGQAELANAAVDAGGSQLQAEPIGQELPGSSAATAGSEFDSTAMKLASIGPTRQRSVNCKLRRRPSIFSERRPVPDARWFQAARAAADEIAMFGGIDLQCHSCSLEIVDVMRAVLAGSVARRRACIACRAEIAS